MFGNQNQDWLFQSSLLQLMINVINIELKGCFFNSLHNIELRS
jgi:hypothetical protein